MVTHLNSLIDASESGGVSGETFIVSGNSVHSPKSMERETEFFPLRISISWACQSWQGCFVALWAGTGQGHCLCTEQRFCASSCEAEREHIMAVLYLVKAQKGLCRRRRWSISRLPLGHSALSRLQIWKMV